MSAETVGYPTIKLANGEELTVNCGIVGIDNDLRIYEGYDGHIDRHDITKSELKRLCDIMSDKWIALKRAVMNGEIITSEKLEMMTEEERENNGIY